MRINSERIRIFFVLLFTVALLSWSASAKADGLQTHDPITAGQEVDVQLTSFMLNEQSIDYTISISGPNAATAPSKVTVLKSRGGVALFKVQTSISKIAQTDILTVTRDGQTTPSAAVHLNILPAVLSSLTLDKSVVVGGTQGSVVTGTVLVASPVEDNVEIPLGCNGCQLLVTMPSAVTIPKGEKTATFQIQTRPASDDTSLSILATTGTILKSTPLTVNVLKPTTVTVSPSTIPSRASATITITLNAPAYDGYIATLAYKNPGAPQIAGKCGRNPQIVFSGQQTKSFTCIVEQVTQPGIADLRAYDSSGRVPDSVSFQMTIVP